MSACRPLIRRERLTGVCELATEVSLVSESVLEAFRVRPLFGLSVAGGSSVLRRLPAGFVGVETEDRRDRAGDATRAGDCERLCDSRSSEVWNSA